MKIPARMVMPILKWELRGKRKQRRKNTVSLFKEFYASYFYSSFDSSSFPS